MKRPGELFRVHVLLAALASTVAAAGCHSLEVADGFRCSSGGKCPSGYQCLADHCYRSGHGPDGGGATGGRGGGSATGGMGVGAGGAIATGGSGIGGAGEVGGMGTVGTGGQAGSGGSSGGSSSGGAAPTDAAVDAPLDVVGGGRDLGAACTAGAQCASTNCVDGLCCETACTGSCVQCNLRNFEGRCTSVPIGTAAPAPRVACTKAAATTCKENGLCDGRGACQLYTSGEVCGSGTCSSATQRATTSMTCDGLGTCRAPTPVDCAPFRCNAALTACATGCVMDADCQGQPCVGGSCGKVANGSRCTSAVQCTSGNCVDGYCCDLACAGSCQACDLSGAVGKCTVLMAGQPPRGSRAACVVGTCGSRCDGVSAACVFAPTTTACGAASCTDGRVTPATTCDGIGACRPPVPGTCGGFGCSGTQCRTTCLVDGDCASTRPYCSGGMCQVGKPLGRACVAGTECASANCVDGVCCSSASCGTCRACNLGTPGTCTNRALNAADAACVPAVGNPNCLMGGCNGLGACLPAASGTQCGPYTCAASAEMQGQYSVIDHHRRACNGSATGAAACQPFTNEGCPMSLVCADATNCRTSCAGDGDCVVGFTCMGTVCRPRKMFGESCTTDRECITRYCVRGACKECSGTPNGCPQNLPVCDSTGKCLRCDGFTPCNADDTALCNPQDVDTFGLVPCGSGAPTCNVTTHHCGCGASGDCARGTICVAGACKIDGRQACVNGPECASGTCTQGLCAPTANGTLCRGEESFAPTVKGGCAQFCFSVDLLGFEQCGTTP